MYIKTQKQKKGETIKFRKKNEQKKTLERVIYKTS